METKDGDRIVTLANQINLEKLARVREEKRKALRLAIRQLEYKLEQGY